MNKILFCGAGYGAGNIGDDAILCGLLFSARMYLRKDTQYGVLTYNSDITMQKTDVDKTFNFITDTEKAFKWATHIVLGGGSLLSGWSIEHCSNLIIRAHAMKKPICLLAGGTSIEPTVVEKAQLKAHFGSLGFITLRSDEDRELVIKWGLDSEKLHVCSDGAFAIDEVYERHDPSNIIGINVVQENLFPKHSYFETLTEVLSNELLDMDVAYICGEVRRQEGFDYFLLEQLAAIRKGAFYNKYVNYVDMLKTLSKCDFVITMRMHIMIFCAIIGVPCIPIVREPKMQLMADDLGIKSSVSLDVEFFELMEMIEKIQKEPETACVTNEDIVDLRFRSYDNGRLLCAWMRLEI